MNFAGGKFEADAFGPPSNGFLNFESAPHDTRAGTITIPDAHLLFSGDFERSGNDLIISDRDHRVGAAGPARR